MSLRDMSYRMAMPPPFPGGARNLRTHAVASRRAWPALAFVSTVAAAAILVTLGVAVFALAPVHVTLPIAFVLGVGAVITAAVLGVDRWLHRAPARRAAPGTTAGALWWTLAGASAALLLLALVLPAQGPRALVAAYGLLGLLVARVAAPRGAGLPTRSRVPRALPPQYRMRRRRVRRARA